VGNSEEIRTESFSTFIFLFPVKVQEAKQTEQECVCVCVCVCVNVKEKQDTHSLQVSLLQQKTVHPSHTSAQELPKH